MIKVGSRWNRWRKCHSKNWVRQNLRDHCVVDGGKLGVDSRDEGSILRISPVYRRLAVAKFSKSAM